MINVNEQNSKVAQEVYVINRWRLEPAVATATLVQESTETIVVKLKGVNKNYKMEDKDILFFESREAAQKSIERIPVKGTKMYLVKDGRIYKRMIRGIAEKHGADFESIVLEFERGEAVDIKEIGKSLFYKFEDAKQKGKELKSMA